MNQRIRFVTWVGVAGVLFFGQVLWLWLLRGSNLLVREGVLVWGQLVLGLAAVGIVGLIKTTPGDAIRVPARLGAAIVLGGTVVLQCLAVLWLTPVLSDDLFRYRIDGRMWLAGVSPYATSPGEFLRERAPDAVDALVPYRDWRTIYPPVSQGVFAGARWVEEHLMGRGDSAAAPPPPASGLAWRGRMLEPQARGRTVVFRAVFAGAALLGVGVLLLVVMGAGESPWWVAVAAWNPLLTLEIGGMGHQDSLGMLLVVATIWAARRRRFRVGAVALALACGVKPVAGLLLPFLWRSCHEAESFHAGRRMVYWFAGTLALVFVPAMMWQQGWAGWRTSLAHFAETWEANGFLYESFKALFGAGDDGRQMERAKDAARLLASCAVLGTGLLLWQARARVVEAAYWLFLVLLLCSPVAYPWYLVWVLAVVPVLRGPQGFAGLVWAATAGMSYTIWRDAGWVWRVPPGYLAGEYLPVLGVLGVEVVMLARRVGRVGGG